MKINSVFFLYMKENRKTFFSLIIVFFIGIIFGIFFINNANEKQIEEICSYVDSLKENIKIADNINKNIILKQSLKQNVLFILLIWILACSLLGSFFIYVTIFYKGFSIGYTASSIIAALGVKTRDHICCKLYDITKYNFFTCNISICK